MAKQHRSAVRVAAMHSAKLLRQAKSQVTTPALLPENPPSPRLRRASWRPPLLEPQD
jgi:hypothetical protein